MQHKQNKVQIHQGNTIEAYKIIGEKCSEAIEWLQRSIVCQSSEPVDGITLHTELVLKKGMQVQVRMMSCFQAILTFPSVQHMDDCLRHHDELDKWFTSIGK